MLPAAEPRNVAPTRQFLHFRAIAIATNVLNVTYLLSRKWNGPLLFGDRI
jgi:hypothetical protein